MRLDRAIVERGLARSRTQAQEYIDAGVVLLNGKVAAKAAKDVCDNDVLSVERADHYVSRAAHKLLGALSITEPLGLSVDGKRVLDAGSSTGGFTQVLLERGAAQIVAVDVGHDQLAPSIREDPRVASYEGVNCRDLSSLDHLQGVDLVVGDLSFISLELVMAELVRFSSPRAQLLLMVKPQFELNRNALNSKGVVRSSQDRVRAVTRVCLAMQDHGLGVVHISESVLPGPQGNVEYFVWATKAWDDSGELAVDVLSPVRMHESIQAVVKGKS